MRGQARHLQFWRDRIQGRRSMGKVGRAGVVGGVPVRHERCLYHLHLPHGEVARRHAGHLAGPLRRIADQRADPAVFRPFGAPIGVPDLRRRCVDLGRLACRDRVQCEEDHVRRRRPTLGGLPAGHVWLAHRYVGLLLRGDALGFADQAVHGQSGIVLALLQGDLRRDRRLLRGLLFHRVRRLWQRGASCHHRELTVGGSTDHLGPRRVCSRIAVELALDVSARHADSRVLDLRRQQGKGGA
mmetsp:Transcript_69113/g.200556  ORF Transcript_69113/g.200556 Transcript_69113/m.200556 type:complete len:242 (-) Transcript_69113:374-1099(-)